MFYKHIAETYFGIFFLKIDVFSYHLLAAFLNRFIKKPRLLALNDAVEAH
jgi:hypothetical protein